MENRKLCILDTLRAFLKNQKNHLNDWYLFLFCPIFAKIFPMAETTKKSTGIYWLLFFASIAAFAFVYKVGGGYCSMVLPFNCTFFAKAMDLM